MAENAFSATFPITASEASLCSNQVDLLIFLQTQLEFSSHYAFLHLVLISWKFPFSLWQSPFLWKYHRLQPADCMSFPIFPKCICSSVIVFIIHLRWFYTKTLLPLPEEMVSEGLLIVVITRSAMLPALSNGMRGAWAPATSKAELWQRVNNVL